MGLCFGSQTHYATSRSIKHVPKLSFNVSGLITSNHQQIKDFRKQSFKPRWSVHFKEANDFIKVPKWVCGTTCQTLSYVLHTAWVWASPGTCPTCPQSCSPRRLMGPRSDGSGGATPPGPGPGLTRRRRRPPNSLQGSSNYRFIEERNCVVQTISIDFGLIEHKLLNKLKCKPRSGEWDFKKVQTKKS